MNLRMLVYILILIFFCVTAHAQFFGGLGFGKNKVQYQKFEWKYIQSKNFDVYYHQGGEYAAKYTAMRAEVALKKIENQLSFSITKRISFIVYNSHNQFQQTNVLDDFMSEGIGGVTELFKNRIVVPFEGDYQKFNHVIHHELVHAVINDLFYGGSIQSLINNSASAMLPLWMNEGFAEYSSSDGLDVKTDMFMRDVAVSEYLRGLHQLNGYFAYRGGQAFWTYIADKYGKGKVGEILNRFRSTGDVNLTFKGALGMTYEELSEQWAKDTKKFYFPDVDRYEYVEDLAKRLTNHQKEDNFYNTSPAISPDGENVAFISDRGVGNFGLYVMNLETKKVRGLATSGRSTDFEELNFLTPGISWDPTGKKLAVGGKAGGQDGIYIVDAGSGSYETLTFGLQTIGGVSWSPDGKYLAFDAAEGGSQSDVYLYEISTKTLRKITNDVFSDIEPVWSPDSQTLYFISDRGRYISGTEDTLNFKMWEHDVEQRDIYRVSIDNPQIVRITSDPMVGKYSIAVAPDNQSILFIADYNGISNLWQLDLNTKHLRSRTNSLQEISQISLSKDGTKLLFASQNRVGYDLFEMKFPFEQKERDTLPVTRFRQNQMEERNSMASLISDMSNLSDSLQFSYGDFDIDFERQQMVRPKEDVAVAGGNTTEEVASTTTDFTPKDYQVKFTPDVVTGNAGFNTFFGAQGTAQALFTDLLGDHEIYFMANIFIDITNSSFYLSYRYLPLPIDYGIAAFQNAGFTVLNTNGLSQVYRMRSYGVVGTASLPLSRYSRFDFGNQVLAMSRENVDDPRFPSLSRFVIVPSLSYVLDDAVPGMWAPVDGNRMNITLEGSPKLSSSGLGFATLRGDLRKYISLGGQYSFALRGSGGMSIGANPQKFFIGGVDNWLNRFFSNAGWPFINPEDFAFTRPGWPIRGWAINERFGSKYFVANAELRFPLLFAFQAGPLPALLQGLQGQFFLDAGGAYNDANQSFEFLPNGFPVPARNSIIWSTGVGIRSIALGMPLRFDVAWRREPTGTFSQPVYLFSFGVDF